MELRITSSLRIQAVRASFLGLPVVEVLDDGVEAAGYQRSHVQGGTDPGASTPDGAFASESAAVPVEGSHSHQGGDLPAVQRAQLRLVGQEGLQRLGRCARGRPSLATRDSDGESGRQETPARSVSLDAGTGDGGSGAQAVLVVGAFGQGVEELGFSVAQRADGRSEK